MSSLGEKELLLDAQQRTSGLWSRAMKTAFAFPSGMWGARPAEARGERAVLLRAKRNGHARSTLVTDPTVMVDPPPASPLGEGASRDVVPERHRRGWLVRRLLTAVDMTGLSAAFILSSVLFADANPVGDHLNTGSETLIFILTLPLWARVREGARPLRARRRPRRPLDGRRGIRCRQPRHVRDLGRVHRRLGDEGCAAGARSPCQLLGVRRRARCSAAASPLARSSGGCRLRADGDRRRRRACRASSSSARSSSTPSTGSSSSASSTSDPRERRTEIADLPVLGGIDELFELVATQGGRPRDRRFLRRGRRADDVARPVAARQGRDRRSRPAALRARRAARRRPPDRGSAAADRAAGTPLDDRRSCAKRVVDIVGALVLLLVTAPFFRLAAIRIRRRVPRAGLLPPDEARHEHDSPFTALKFRTMKVGTDEAEHREYIQQHDDAERDAGRQRDLQARARGRVSRRSAGSCGRRASTNCRS